jgi:hypothetical protein
MARISLAGVLAGALLCTTPTLSPAADQGERSRDILGWVEFVEFAEPRLRLKAKLDTGATTSSLNALNQEPFEKDGKPWMRFDMRHPTDRERLITLEAPLVRTARIRRHNSNVQERPVVNLGMCIGDVWRKRQFTLIDRSDFAYQVLVGRNFMRGYIAVDSDETYLSRPRCKQLGDGEPTYAPNEPKK